MNETFLEELKDIGCTFLENAPLGSYSSLQIGGKANVAAWPENATQIINLIKIAKKNSIPYYILGNCTNVLVMDEGVEGLVILFGRSGHNYHHIEQIDDFTITAEAGASLQDVCMFAYGHGLTGLEFAYGIPASVGGAIYMNSGAFDGEIKDVCKSVTFIDENNEIQTLENKDLDFSYRHSYFHDKKCCILEATFELKAGNKDQIKEKMDDFLSRRVSKQPLEYPSAGSTFKRPGGAYASKLIDESGLRGYRIGGAMVSEKHTGFVINYDHATSKDVLELVSHIQKTVDEKTGFKLECEMIILK